MKIAARNWFDVCFFCFETERRWEEEGTGDAIPIFLYYLILKKILPNIADEFLEYF